MDFVKGKVYTFRYNGGSNPGSLRTLSVSSVCGTHVQGIDLDKGQPRNFRYALVSNLREIKDVKHFDGHGLPSGITLGDIGKQFEREGYKTYTYDDQIVAIKNINEYFSTSVKRQSNIKEDSVTLLLNGRRGQLQVVIPLHRDEVYFKSFPAVGIASKTADATAKEIAEAILSVL